MMMQYKGPDRRKFPRINYPCLITLRSRDDNEEPEVILTHTENVGVGGVCIILKRPIEQGTSVEIELDLLDAGVHVNCKGKAVWSIQRSTVQDKKPSFYDIGIELTDIDYDDQKRIDSIVKKLVQQGSNLIKD